MWQLYNSNSNNEIYNTNINYTTYTYKLRKWNKNDHFASYTPPFKFVKTLNTIHA
jgi:hypothetical protein